MTGIRRRVARISCTRLVQVRPASPVVSFTFDDFPASALLAGGKILRDYGAAGTYFAALGLMGHDSPSGPIFAAGDLPKLLSDGHELGCHTFDHVHSWDTPPTVYEQSIIENARNLQKWLPGAAFATFAYPISEPSLGVKRRAGPHFAACRGGGQTFNAGRADLNCLAAFFLEKCGDSFAVAEDVIRRNNAAGGWLIFATHDVAERPSRFGVTPKFLEMAIQFATKSGARILPMDQALKTCIKIAA